MQMIAHNLHTVPDYFIEFVVFYVRYILIHFPFLAASANAIIPVPTNTWLKSVSLHPLRWKLKQNTDVII